MTFLGCVALASPETHRHYSAHKGVYPKTLELANIFYHKIYDIILHIKVWSIIWLLMQKMK